jgi:tRNA(Glu) U13 pseudouridine synthase TruD
MHHCKQRFGVQRSGNGCALLHCRWQKRVWFLGDKKHKKDKKEKRKTQPLTHEVSKAAASSLCAFNLLRSVLALG